LNRHSSSIYRNCLLSLCLAGIIAPAASAQTIFTAGTVNSADYSRSFAPGALISIFGTNLAASTAQWTSFPLPASLAGTSVQLVSNSEQLPLFFVSPGQINTQLPFDLAPGPVKIAVRTASGLSASDTITVSTQAPKFFTLDLSGFGSAIATTPDYKVLTSSLPATPAAPIVLWMNSMGATTGTAVAGQAAPGAVPGSQPLTLASTPTVTINGANAPVLFAGLTPGLSGLYQLNVQAPFVTLTGPVDIQVTAGGVSAQLKVTIPYRQLGFYYSVLGGKPVAGQTLNGVSGSTSDLAFRQSDTISWGSTGYNAWTNNTGLSSIYSGVPGIAITLLNGTTPVYDNNGIEDGTYGQFYNNTGGPANSEKPGLSDLYSMSNYFPLTFAGYFKLSQATTITKLIGYFDPNGSVTLPFDPGNPFVKYRMNIWSSVSGNLPMDTGNFVGNVFSSDTTAGTFSYSTTGVQLISNSVKDTPKDVYRLAYTLNAPITLPAGEYWLSHDASVRTTPGATSTAKNSIPENAFTEFITSHKVEGNSVRVNVFGLEMLLKPSFFLPEAHQIRPSAPVQPR
jgi:uncharacterized protein (TIGR03437 family)